MFERPVLYITPIVKILQDEILYFSIQIQIDQTFNIIEFMKKQVKNT